MSLTKEQRAEVAEMILQKRFNKEERAVVHALGRHVKVEQIPLLGQLLDITNDSARQIGLMLIKGAFFMGLGGLVLLVWMKFH